MKCLLISALALFSFSTFACRYDINLINKKVADMMTENLDYSSLEVISQELISTKEDYPEIMTSSCPDSATFIHLFAVKKGEEACTVITKYKMTFSRIEINPFAVLDVDCQ